MILIQYFISIMLVIKCPSYIPCFCVLSCIRERLITSFSEFSNCFSMEANVLAVEEDSQLCAIFPRESKSVGSLVRIDSISIDLGIEIEKSGVEKCQHFSIRGYVADMRKKDRKICSPFPLDENNHDIEQLLPPIFVAKFRWWRCQNCLEEIGAASASEEIGVVSKCCKRGFESSSTCSHMLSPADATIVPLDLQKALRVNNFDGSKADVVTSVDVAGDKFLISSCSYKEERNAKVEQLAITGHENDSKEQGNQEIDNPTSDMANLKPCLSQERQAGGSVTLRSKSIEVADISKPTSEIHGDTDFVPCIESPKCQGSISAEICLVEKLNFLGDEQNNLSKGCEASNHADKLDDALNANNIPEAKLASVNLKEQDNESSESDEILGVRNIRDQNHELPSGWVRRRTRKVRLLTELLGGKGNAGNNHKKTENVFLNSMADASAGLGWLPGLNDEMSLNENMEKSFKGPKRKRKMPQVENFKQLEVGCLNNVAKEVKTIDGTETSIPIIETSDSEHEEDVVAGVSIQIGTKGERAKYEMDRSSIPSLRKNKQSQVVDGYSLLVPHIEFPSGDEDTLHSGSHFSNRRYDAFTAFTGSGMGSHSNSYLYPRPEERKSSLSRKESKMPQLHGESSQMSPTNNMPIEDSVKAKNVEFTHFHSATGKLQPKHDASTKVGLDLSLNSFMSTERDDRNNIALENMIDSLPSLAKSTPSKSLWEKDGLHVGESSVLYNPTPDSSFRRALLCDPNEKTAHGTAILQKKRNCFSLLKEGSFPLHKKLDFSGSCNNEGTFEVLEHSEAIQRHSNQGTYGLFEHGTSVDIPMEIVELMAKNQYDRLNYEAEKHCCLSVRSSNNANVELMGFPNKHDSEKMRSLHKEYPGTRKFLSANSRNDIIRTGENVGATTSNPVNFSHINRDHLFLGKLEENTAFTMFNAFPQNQETLSSGNQFSASASTRNNIAQNCQGYDDKLSHRSSVTTTQLETRNIFHSAPRQNEEAEQLWSPMTQNHMPFSFNISQKGLVQSSSTEMHPQCPDRWHERRMVRDLDLNSSNVNATRMEKQKKNLASEYFNRATTGYPFVSDERTELQPLAMGYLDSYSNETIPAMQLLSLMDAAIPSKIPFSLDAKKLLEKPFVPCDYHPKVSVDGKMKLLEKSFFPNPRHFKDFSGHRPAVYKTNDSRCLSSVCVSRSLLSENSCEISPTDPASIPLASLFQSDRVFKAATGFTGKKIFRSKEQQKAKKNYSPVQNRGRKSQKSMSSTGGSSRFCDYNSHLDKQKEIPGSLDSMDFPVQCHKPEAAIQNIELEALSMQETVCPTKSNLKNDICHLNENPADFSILNDKNPYMIGIEMLQPRYPPWRRSALANMDRKKRLKVSRLRPVKEHGIV